MRDYYRISLGEHGTKYYLNEKNQFHRLNGPAVEWYDGDCSYYVDGHKYAGHLKEYSCLYINFNIFKSISQYEIYIKQNIKQAIAIHNLKIEFTSFHKDQINEFPNWLKDLIIL